MSHGEYKRARKSPYPTLPKPRRAVLSAGNAPFPPRRPENPRPAPEPAPARPLRPPFPPSLPLSGIPQSPRPRLFRRQSSRNCPPSRLFPANLGSLRPHLSPAPSPSPACPLADSPFAIDCRILCYTCLVARTLKKKLARGAVAIVAAALVFALLRSAFPPKLARVRYDNVIVEAIALTGWKGETRRSLRRMLLSDVRGFEEAAAGEADTYSGLSIERGIGFVDFRDKLCALRYFPEGIGRVSEDSEILRADRLDDSWWVYEADWN